MRQLRDAGPNEKVSCWVCGLTLYRMDAALNAINKEVHPQCLDIDWFPNVMAIGTAAPQPPEPPYPGRRDYWLPRAMHIATENAVALEAWKPHGDMENLESFRRHFALVGG